MPKPGGDLAELELSQLLEELAIAKDTHFKLRLRNATGQLDNTAELNRVRKQIAAHQHPHPPARDRGGRGRVVENRGGQLMAEEETSEARTARKVRDGIVVSNKMDKTAVVTVVERVRHAKYAKFVNRTKRLYVQDDANDVNIGDRVRIMETRPTSKLKRWRVVEVLERAK